MKKLLLSATACLLVAVSLKAQQVQPCGTYQAREYYLKNVPGYAAKLNAAEAASRAEYQAFLQQQAQSNPAAKNASVSSNYTYTVPVVFHILHQGEAYGTAPNIDDADCIAALAQVNSDYARMGSDTGLIDPLFKPLYEDAHMHFMLAQKDPNGNCTNGIIHHYDNKTQWDQTDLSNYQYSTYAAGSWNPSKYLNIYIVKNIIASGSVVGGGIIVGYTHLPGTAPISAADAIVYRNDFLTGGLNARSLSHEIGHWFGLSHTFGSTNDPGFECGNDDINDTPPTTGFFSTCPKPGYAYTAPAAVAVPTDASDITKVKFGKMENVTAVNSLNGTFVRNLNTMVATTVTPLMDTSNVVATGTAGSYSDFTLVYGNDFNAGTAGNLISITSAAAATDSNYVALYIDYNNNASFADAGEAIFTPTYGLLGTQTYTRTYTIPSGKYGLYRMRVITSKNYITGPNVSITSGEIEEYNLNIGTTPSPTTGINMTMATCDPVRPNIENIMDYSSCPKMFTKGQNDKVRLSASSAVGNRDMLTSELNLYNVGLYNTISVGTFTAAPVPPSTVVTTYTAWVASNPATVSPCAPIADFASNKLTTCAGQSILYTNTAYNGTGFSYSWEFEGGTPSTSTLAAQSVTYSTPGSYSVSLTVTNAQGVSTKTISSVVTNWNAPQVTLPYIEDFENFQGYLSGWNIPANPDPFSPTWEISTQYGAGVPQTKSLLLPNANGAQGFFGNDANVDVIETPTFDFSNVTNVGFQFDYSFARKTGVVADTFKVQYSLDCGGTWKTFVGSPTASSMAVSGGTVNAPYIPWSGATSISDPSYKWKTATIPSFGTNVIANKRDVKFRFWFKNDVSTGQSQNLYIDNLNISGTVGIHEFENSLGLSIYPNPTSGASVVEFTSPNNSKVNILVYDVTGRMVEQTELNANAGVTNKHSVNASGKLTAGIYFISLTIDNDKVVKKLIVN